MPSEAQIRITAENQTPQAFRQVDQSLKSLDQETRAVQSSTRQSAAALGLFDDEAKQAAIGVTSLGRSVFNTSNEARKFGGVFRGVDGRLREANGRFVKGKESVEQLGRSFQRTGKNAGILGRGFTQASGGASILTRSVGNLGSVVSGLGIAIVTREIGRFGIASVQAAGQMEQLRRATEQIQGSAAAAETRISQLIEVANLPGLNFEPLVRYSNQFATLGLSAEDTDKILLGVGQTIVSLGGTSASSEQSLIQILQAFRAGTIDLRDFRTIIQQIPGFLEAAADVHGVEANIEGLREAFEKTGGSMRDLLIPTFDELSRRFEAPPADSYIVAMDTLQNAFFLTQSAIGDLLLPTITKASIALSEFLEVARTGLNDFEALPKPIQDIVAGARELYDALQSVIQSVGSVLAAPLEYLISNFGSLLGSVLELAAALYTALEPVLKAQAVVIGTVVTAVAQLAEHLTLLIGGLADGVNWITSFWREEEQAVASTDKLTASIGAATDALEKNATAGDRQRAKLRDLQTQLDETNAKIEDYEKKIKGAGEAGLSNRSIENLERLLETSRARIGELESEIKTLAATYGGATAALNENATATEQQQAKLKDLQTQLEGVNQEVDTYVERIDKAKKNEDTIASIAQLEGWLNNTKKTASELQTEIDTLTGSLEASESATDASSESTGNFSLQLAKLKAQAEDARETLRNSTDFSALGANYQAAIAASDAYYNRQITNLQTLLAEQKEGSEEYNKTETEIFERQRQREQARQTLRTAATRQGESESKRRIEIIEKENEELRAAGEETARALEASEKRRTAAAEAEQKRLTQVHQQNIKAREEAERAANQRSVQDSEERISALQNAFENAHPESVDRAYENIQQATVSHYETLKNQARQRISDEDALNTELVSLDRQRNAALEDNHRDFLQRIAQNAKALLGERTEAFKTASNEILHDWERTVSEFERQLREAETEDAIREIERDFEAGQQNMLASLESVLRELGFSAEETAEIMKSVFRTAEGEAGSFADRIISAFKRLGKEADRETKKQNREVKKSYRELVSEIEGILNGIRDFFTQIAQDGDLEVAFRDLGERLGNAVLDKFNEIAADGITEALLNISKQNITASAGTGGAARTAGAGSGLASAGSITGLVSLLTSPAILAAIVPAAVFAATYYIGKQVAGDSSGVPVNRQGRPLEDNETRRRRGETQSSYERRLQANADAEATEAQRQTFFDTYDPRAPILRSIQDSGVFTGNSGVFAENAANLTEIDVFGRVDLPGLIGDLEGILQTRVEGLGADMERAAEALESAQVSDIQPALQDYLAATGDFFQTQIDFANFVRRTTGHLDFGDVEDLTRELQNAQNAARLQDTSVSRGSVYRRLQQSRETQANIDAYNALAAEQGGTPYGDTAVDAEVAATDDILGGISDLDISNLQGVADDALSIFRDAITAPARTIESINAAFESLLPDLRTLYDNIREQIIGTDGIISDAEQIQLNNLGSFEDFTQQYANLRDQAIDGVNATQQRLAITSQQIATGEGIRQFGELANAPNATIEGLTTAWTQNVLPLVNALYDDLFAQIAGPDGFINTADEQIEFLGLGSREDFVSDYENNILNPALDSLTTIEQNIAQLLQGRELENTFDNFNDASLAPGQTIAGLTTYWETNVVPVLRETYNGLRDQIIGDDGLISPAEMEQLIQMGLDLPFEDWVGEYEDGLLTPGLDRLQTAAGVIASITQDREQSAVIEMFNEAITAPGQTIDGLNTFWVQQVVPELRETYNFLRNEIIGEDGLISPEEAATLTQAGLDIPFEDWVSSFEDNILTPGIDRLSGVAAVIASVMQNREESNIIEMFNAAAVAPGATIEGVNQYWVDTVVPVLRQTYESLRNDIIGEDGLISPEEAAELVSRGLDIPFEDWVTPYENDILTPAIDSLSAAAQVIASVTQSGEQSAVIEMFNNSVKAPGATIAGLTAFWQAFVVPELRQTYDALRDGIIGEDGLISPQELAELTQQGLNVPFEDWAGQFENDILTPGIDFLKGEAEYLQSTQLTTGVDDVIEVFKEQAAAPGATLAALTQEWNETVVPALRALYQDLYDDIAGADGIINTTREEADLLKLGSEADFVSGFGTDVFNPLVGSLQSRQSRSRSALGQNAISRGQFDLGNATGETEFETRRGDLITAINTYYDAELERINGLKLSEAELQDLREDNTLAREQALRSAETATNRFAEERISAEIRLQDEIADLRDDGFEAEADRLASLENLQARHNAKILDLEEDFQEDLEDLRRERLQDAQDLATEYQRDIQDLQNKFARELFGDSVVSFADLTAEQQRQLQSNTGFQQERFDLDLERDRDRQDINTESGVLRAGSAGEAFYRQQIESGELTDTNLIERLFGRQGLDDFIDLTRGTEDAQETLDASVPAIETESRDLLTSIYANIALLTEGQLTDATTATLTNTQQQTATLESQTAMMAAETTAMMGETTATQMATAEMESATAAQYATIVETLDPAVVAFGTASEMLLAAAVELTAFDLTTLVAAVERIPTALLGFTEAVELLPQRLDDALNSSFKRLPDLYAQGIGAAPSTASLLPAATGTQPANQEVPPIGVGNGGFGGQEIRITLVGNFGDGFTQKMAEQLVRLGAEGRILQ